jgi:hypothetical protein
MTAHIERVLYGDRTIGNYDNPATGESEPGWADLAYESIRAMNHITMGTGGEGIPAPVVYGALGNLAGMAHMLPQLMEQLANGLATSLEHFDVYDNKQEPSLSVQAAAEQLANAGVHAMRMAEALSAAQVAINSQGYNDKEPNE